MFFYLTPLAYCCVPSQREKRWGMNVLLAYGMVLGGKNRLWYSNRMPDWVGTFLARRMAMKLFPMIGPWSHNRQCQNVFFCSNDPKWLIRWKIVRQQYALRFIIFCISLIRVGCRNRGENCRSRAKANVCVGVCWGEGNCQNWCPLSVRLLVFLRLGDNLLKRSKKFNCSVYPTAPLFSVYSSNNHLSRNYFTLSLLIFGIYFLAYYFISLHFSSDHFCVPCKRDQCVGTKQAR